MTDPSPTASKAVTQTINVLRRTLKPRHIQMIALGGAIGTGLFYGSSESIGLAGPSVLLTYAIGGLMIFLVVRALGEMSVDEPVSGAFSHYANKNWSARAGFVSGWNYWFNYIAVSMVELAVVGSFVNYWLPGIPGWVSAAVFLVLITAINLVGVRVFGEFEFWLALIKVIAVIGMIVLGAIVVVAGINNSADLPDPSFTHLWDQGGFFPMGLSGMLFALVVVMFSFGGTELIGITAGEAEHPERTIPKAINQVIFRILIFYIGALAVIMAIVPWDRLDGETSPFVQIFDRIGVPGAAHILNLVVLTAVISVYNSGLYANGRMLRSLALQGNAPKYLKAVSRNGVPIAGVLTSSAVTVLAVVVVFLWPAFAFQYLMSIATIAAIINWSMIMITQLKFRRRIGPDGVAALTFTLPFARVTPWIVLSFFAVLAVLMCFHPGYRTAVIVGPIWLAALLIAYQVKQGRQLRAARHHEAELGRETQRTLP
ncbi:amino acid/polyamine/organocation transporter (APC superfamily) [Leucobacter luti]|uniref:Amino acid/polyamine/organocation transporter (APC superfamily) n=1 Tax=Leucobacter luti TaxID=340320 RepID=A0A4R6RVG7_9MICO|nr:amino acid permease [Leucobacter luti]TDP90933.1 amino acid/polyamine/organocation transporter (APC superfamily) [Leucobacter luti]